MASYVYMLASRRNGTLYTGVTTELTRRVSQHRMHLHSGFTKTYDVTRLVWFETYADIENAIRREKRIKRWRREWKLQLIETVNPQWRDLYDDLFLPPDRLPFVIPDSEADPGPRTTGATCTPGSRVDFVARDDDRLEWSHSGRA